MSPEWQPEFCRPGRERLQVLQIEGEGPTSFAQRIGRRIERALDEVPGTLSAYSERVAGGRYIDILPDRLAASRYGLNITDINQLIAAANTAYRLAREREKPDVERKMGYQERDLRRIKARIMRSARSFDAMVDMALLQHTLESYAALPTKDRLAAIDKAILVDTAHFARAAGNRRAQNMVMVGAAAPLLDFAEDRLLAFVAKLFERKGDKLIRVNQRAFALGRSAGQFFRALTDGGVAKRDALRLVGKFTPDSLEADGADALGADWARALAADPELLEAVLGETGSVAADRIPTGA